MTDEKRSLKVFLSHASADKPKVRELYRYLQEHGIQPWLDIENLVSGQDKQAEIDKALDASDVIIICHSKKSADEKGNIQKEIRWAQDRAKEMPESYIFLVPARFEECELLLGLDRYERVDLYKPGGYQKLMEALKLCSSQRGRADIETPKPNKGSPSMANFDASNYVETVIRQYENYHLYLNHEKRREDPAIFERVFATDLHNTFVPLSVRDKRGILIPSLDTYVDTWLAEDNRNHLVLLGNYGSGKTAFCFHLVHRLLLSYRDDPTTNILPLYVTFRQLMKGENNNLEEMLVGLLTDKPPKDALRGYEIKGLTCQNLYDTLRNHDVLLIMDGFDEIDTSLKVEKIIEHFSALKNVLQFTKKIIITCRENYLPSEESLDAVFPAQSNMGRLSSAYDLPFDVLRLSHFDETQQKYYLDRTVKDEEQRSRILNSIQGTYDLPDLASRPILLWMIIQYFEQQVVDSKRITVALLYDKLVTNWLRDNFLTRLANIDIEDGMQVFESLAIKLNDEKVELIDERSLLELLVTKLGEASLGKSVNIKYLFETCSFLQAIGGVYYGFIHRSFLEFFLARALLHEIEQGNNHRFGQARLFGEIVGFLAGLVQDQPAHIREKIKQQLVEWVGQSREKTAQKYLGGNSAALLCHLRFRFKGLDLSGVNFLHADLSKGDFRECNLSNAILDGSNLTNTNFSSSNLQNTGLSNTFIKETLFRNANLQGASFLNLRMIGGPTTIWNAAFSPDKHFIVIGTSKGQIIILPYPRSSSQEFVCIDVSDTDINHFSFSANGESLAMCDRSRMIYIYSWQKLIAGEECRPQKLAGGSNDHVRWLEFAPDKSVLLSGGRDHSVKLWYLEEEPIRVKSFWHHTEPVMCVAWQRGTNYVASGGYDCNVYIWSVDQDEVERVRYPLVEMGKTYTHNNKVRAIAFNSTGQILATAGEGDSIKLWDVSDPEFPKFSQKISTSVAVFNLAFVSKDKILIAGCADGMLFKYDLSTGRLLQKVKAHQDFIRSFSVHTEDNLLLTSSWDGTVKLWNMRDLSELSLIYDSAAANESAAVSYGIQDAFKNANITSLRDLTTRWIDFFIELGAISVDDNENNSSLAVNNHKKEF